MSLTEVPAKLATLQLLEDAIAFRTHRLNTPCPDCTPSRKCDDHACDVDLVERYQARYATAFTDAFANVHPADITLVTQPPDGTPPGIALTCAAILDWLRDLAADGPIVTDLDGSPVVIELDGPNVIEHPLAPGDDRSDH